MAIAPLQLPGTIQATPIDWSGLDKIGQIIANNARQKQIGDAVSAATGPDGKIDANAVGASLARLGLTQQAMPFVQMGQTAQFHQDTLGQQQAQLAESSRHDRATEGQSAAQLAEMRRQHDLELSKPMVAGEDPYSGTKSYIARDASGNYKPVIVPQPTTNVQQPQYTAPAPPQPTTPGQSTFQDRFEPPTGPQSATAPPAPTDPAAIEDQRKAAFLASRPPQVAAIIKGIANYEMDPRTVLSRLPAGPRERILGDVAAYRPDYNQQNYPASQATYTKFTSGKESATVRAFNVGLEHLDQLQELGTALGNGNIQRANALWNWAKTELGYSGPTNFNGLKAIVGAEIVKAIVGAGGTGEERDQAARTVAAASSPEQLMGIAQTYKNAMGAQLGGLKRTYEEGSFRKDFKRFLSPAAVKAFEAHEKQIAGGGDSGNGGAQPKAFDPSKTKIPMDAATMLKSDPSPQRRKQFDEVFGIGASDRIVGPAK